MAQNFLTQMKNLNVNKGLTKYNQQCLSYVTQFSVAKKVTWEADGYPYFAETTWTLGTREARIHHNKLPHLPAKQPKCLIRNSLPSAFQLSEYSIALYIGE